LSAQERQQFSVPGKIQGAVVTEVDPSSAAAERRAEARGRDHGDQQATSEIGRRRRQTYLKRQGQDHSSSMFGAVDGSHYLVVDESKAG